MKSPKYKRVLLKLSGEALAGDQRFGLNIDVLKSVGQTIKKVVDMDVEIGIVVGGGNFWRGRTSEGMDRVAADHIGMLATTMNALALADALEQSGCVTRVMSAIEMRQICETYIRKRAVRHLEKGRVTIFGCGTGNPYFSTDTAAALRAAEINADVILKATNVDGVYDKDPAKFPEAVKYDQVTHDEVLQKKLGVMDANAAAICRDNQIDILVFNVNQPDHIYQAIMGEALGTLVV